MAEHPQSGVGQEALLQIPECSSAAQRPVQTAIIDRYNIIVYII